MAKDTQYRQGFTLIELLVVIMIVSLVYFFCLIGVEKISAKPQPLTPLNLKSILLQNDTASKRMTLMCLNKCQTCYLKRQMDGSFEIYDNSIDLTDTKVYTLNSGNDLTAVEYGRYQDDKICLLIDFYPNGSSTQLILKQRDKVYFLPAFFKEPIETKTIEEAKEIWLENSRLLSDNGDFY